MREGIADTGNMLEAGGEKEGEEEGEEEGEGEEREKKGEKKGGGRRGAGQGRPGGEERVRENRVWVEGARFRTVEGA